MQILVSHKNYNLPQEYPASRMELKQHIFNAEHSGTSFTHEQHTKDIEQWLNNL
jgi:hypothetical protein